MWIWLGLRWTASWEGTVLIDRGWAPAGPRHLPQAKRRVVWWEAGCSCVFSCDKASRSDPCLSYTYAAIRYISALPSCC